MLYFGNMRLFTNLALMLVWESQCFDLKAIWLASQAIDRNAQGMYSQLADQTSTHTPEGMGRVLFNRELVRYLAMAVSMSWRMVLWMCWETGEGRVF